MATETFFGVGTIGVASTRVGMVEGVNKMGAALVAVGGVVRSCGRGVQVGISPELEVACTASVTVVSVGEQLCKTNVANINNAIKV